MPLPASLFSYLNTKKPTPSELLDGTAIIVITGGSSGIGASLIKLLKSVKPELVICNLSRTQPEDFLSPYDHHLQADLEQENAITACAASLRDRIHSAPAGKLILINNSGIGDYGRAQNVDRAKQLALLAINVRAVLDLSYLLMPILLERGGTVVNIASTAAFQPTAYLASYGASKAFLLNWTLALNEELRGTSARAIAVCPGPTCTAFFKSAGFESAPLDAAGANWISMTADAVAAEIVSGLGRRSAVIVPGWKNRWLVRLSSVLPLTWRTRLSACLMERLRLEALKN
jgi:short-subunit dehydrogenase